MKGVVENPYWPKTIAFVMACRGVSRGVALHVDPSDASKVESLFLILLSRLWCSCDSSRKKKKHRSRRDHPWHEYISYRTIRGFVRWAGSRVGLRPALRRSQPPSLPAESYSMYVLYVHIHQY